MSPESKDFKLFTDMWNMLEGENHGGVTVENLLYFLLIIRGAKFPRRVADDEQVDSSKTDFFKNAKIGDKGQLLIYKGGQEKIFAHFKDFYVNRLQFEGLVQKKAVKQITIDITTPKYSKTSKKITKQAVEKHRKDIIGNAEFDIVSYLYAKELSRAQEKKLKQEIIESEKAKEEEQESTFKPKTIDFKHKLDQYKVTSGDRNLDLNNKIQKGQYALRHNKDREEYEYDKNYQECTYTP